jgi:prophage regulatory protein
MTQKLVSKKELRLVFGVPYSFAHIARLEAACQFPKRIRLGACRVAWLSAEVQNWIDERVALRNATSPS